MTLNHDFLPDDQPSLPNHRYRTGLPAVISSDEFYHLLATGRVVDGRAGGMILGKELGEGNARLLFKVGSGFVLRGGICGGSFLLNSEASCRHQDRLRAMLAGLTMKETVPQSQTDELGQLIVATAFPHDRLVWITIGQTIIGPEAAMKHVLELGRLNLDPNPYLHCDLYQVFGCEPGTEDGIV